MTPCYIAKELTRREIPTPGGKKIWAGRTIESILTNEKYKGDALLQKKFTVDFLPKGKKSMKAKFRNIMWSTVIRLS